MIFIKKRNRPANQERRYQREHAVQKAQNRIEIYQRPRKNNKHHQRADDVLHDIEIEGFPSCGAEVML